MNLFWKKMFGTLQSTAKTEAKYVELSKAFERYQNVLNSKELEEYKELYEKVKSPEFKENKKTLQSRKYKDTLEYRDTRKLNKLEKDVKLNAYFRVLDSDELKEYTQFEKTSDYQKLGDPKEVKQSEKLTRLKKFEKSAEYKNYLRFRDSYLLKEYNALKEKVATPEFIESNKFWSNNNRWEETQEAKTERRYFDLCENDDIKFYIRTDAKQFESIAHMQLAFTEQFDWNTLNNSRWDFGFHQKAKELNKNYSFTTQKQAYNNGENVTVNNGIFTLTVKKETKQGTAWDEQIGFVNKEFDYTSDVIHGHEAICQKEGILSTKIKFAGNKEVSHIFSLKGDYQAPHIVLCKNTGKDIEVGVYWKSKFEDKFTGTHISGINPNEFYIYSLVWNDHELIWYINNLEVFRTTDGIPSEPIYPMINSMISDKQKGAEGKIEIDWIEAFTNK